MAVALAPPRRSPTPPPPSTRTLASIVVAAEEPSAGWAAEALLTAASVLGVVVVLTTLVASHLGVRPLVVRSGSMEPAIPTGSMVLVHRVPAAAVRPGDIVSVTRPDHMRVTHRVVRATPSPDRPGDVTLVLKGDANPEPDPAPVTVSSVDRLALSAPGLGRALAWLATAPGGFALGCLLTGALWAVLRRRPSERTVGGVRI
jgi:signal peptidase